MPNVQMPDGTVVAMPDKIDPALGARLRAYQNDHDIGIANAAANAKEQGPVQDFIDMVKSGVTHIPGAAKGMLDSLKGDPLHNPDIGANFSNAAHTIAHPQEALSAAGSALENATPQQVGANVVAPLLVGGAAGKVVGAVGGAEAAAAEGPLGMRTGANNGIARTVAGDSARPAVTAHNQSLADQALGAQAGVPVGTKIDATSLAKGREAPDSVYERAAANIPTGPLSPNAAQAVRSVGADDMIVRSPDTQATIDAQKARLLSGPLSGSQTVDAQRALRFNGFRNVGSKDPEQTALGQAQLKMADALHQHMVDTLPENAPVTADQLQAARVALAQNHTVENALGPNGNVNLTKLAKVHNDNPNMLSGPMKDIAQFASDHPEVTQLPSMGERFNPSGVAKDIASVDLKSPATFAQPFFGAAARRTLTGPARMPDVPVTGLGGEFDPLAPRQPAPLDLTSPPGQAFEPHQRSAALADALAPLQQPLELTPPPGTALEPHQPQLATGMSEKDRMELIKKRKKLGESF